MDQGPIIDTLHGEKRRWAKGTQHVLKQLNILLSNATPKIYPIPMRLYVNKSFMTLGSYSTEIIVSYGCLLVSRPAYSFLLVLKTRQGYFLLGSHLLLQCLKELST